MQTTGVSLESMQDNEEDALSRNDMRSAYSDSESVVSSSKKLGQKQRCVQYSILKRATLVDRAYDTTKPSLHELKLERVESSPLAPYQLRPCFRFSSKSLFQSGIGIVALDAVRTVSSQRNAGG